jgi:hypothetical protein
MGVLHPSRTLPSPPDLGHPLPRTKWLPTSTQARASSLFLLVLISACAPAHVAPPARPLAFQAQTRIVTAGEVTTEAELSGRAERAMLEQRWQDAIRDYRTLVSADPDGPRASEYLFDLALALESFQDRAQARDILVDLARRFPGDKKARSALVRAAALDAYLEDWSALKAIGTALLARADLEDVDRLVALGARGLAAVELHEEMEASRDILDGLDLADQLHYGERDVLPVAIAELYFALGELRRLRSEKNQLVPDGDFLDVLDRRCAGLLQAQAAYARTVRSVDLHWATMAGYRVGEMYRALHSDLMRIPPPSAKSDRKRAIFYAFMHVRYRVLLEKGLREIEQTIALGERTSDSSLWIARARETRALMQAALAEEREQIAKMPFTEAEVQKALELMEKRASPPKKPGSA